MQNWLLRKKKSSQDYTTTPEIKIFMDIILVDLLMKGFMYLDSLYNFFDRFH